MKANSITHKNPYVIGRPIDEKELLFGRESIVQFIEANLQLDVKVLFVYGQRRIGLSSIIRNIPSYFAQEEFVFVTFDIQDYSQESLGSLLYALIAEILTSLNFDVNNIIIPSLSELENSPEIFFYQFIPQVHKQLHNQKIVFLFNDILTLKSEFSSSNIIHFYYYLHSHTQYLNNLCIIFFIRGQLVDNSYLFNLFPDAPNKEVGFLDESSARKLITKPSEGVLQYHEDAVTAILELSAGHPYFIQVICFTLFVEARLDNNWKVTSANVEAIVDKAIESAEAGLAWLWDGISIPERVVLSAIAEAQKTEFEKGQPFPTEPLAGLEKRCALETEEIILSAVKLASSGFLDESKRKIKIEFLRRWVLQRHPIQKQIQELPTIKKERINLSNTTADSVYPVKPCSLPSKLPGKIILSVILTGVITGVGVGSYKIATACPTVEIKVNGIFCIKSVEKNITSRGERTLFPTLSNSFRDQGILAFQKSNYNQAVNYFSQAVQSNRNDPEVLIYYNNALARKQGSPFTFAVAVPTENRPPIAQEILRGVALSQNQFNSKGGIDGHLLEIVIAKDSEDLRQAKKVAQQLINDKSVLAVIGHYTSEVTGAAFYEYQRAEPRLAVVSPTSGSSLLQDDFYFKTTPSSVQFGEQLAEYISKEIGSKKVVVFYNPADLFSNDIREQFTNNFTKLDGEVVENIDLANPNLDVEEKLNAIVYKYKAQAALLFPAPQYTAMALEIMRTKANSQDSKVKNLQFLGSSSLYNEKTLKEGEEAIENLILTVPWFREAPESKNFAKKAQQQWLGKISWNTATSYDATQALIQALSKNPSRQTVLQKLKQVDLSPQQTSGNILKFTSEGERQIKPILVKIHAGKFQVLKN